MSEEPIQINYITLLHIEFTLHLAAVLFEILLGIFVVEMVLDKREKKQKLRELMYIKSCMFRSEMKKLFLANFQALKFPSITMSQIKNATLEELVQMRKDAEYAEYKSLEKMETVIIEYVKAEKVWHTFKDIVVTKCNHKFESNELNVFESIFQDMIFILHFIYDVKIFKKNNPNALFISEACKKKMPMEKTKKVLVDGIKKFLDYAIELKKTQPDMFNNLFSDYELAEKNVTFCRDEGGWDRRSQISIDRRAMERHD